MTYRAAVAKSTYDVLGTAGTIPNLLDYSSDYNTLKYHSAGSTQLVVDLSSYYGTFGAFGGTFYRHYAVSTIAHNLGYVPFFTGNVLALTTTPPQWSMVPVRVGAGAGFLNQELYADNTNLYFQYHDAVASSSGLSTIPFMYRIFRNNLGL